MFYCRTVVLYRYACQAGVRGCHGSALGLAQQHHLVWEAQCFAKHQRPFGSLALPKMSTSNTNRDGVQTPQTSAIPLRYDVR